MRIHGRRMYLFSGGDLSELTPIGCTTECALNISVETIQLCRRAGVERSRAGRKVWGVSAGGFLVENGDILPTTKIIGQPLSVAITVLREDLLSSLPTISAICPDEEVTLIGRVIVDATKLVGANDSLTMRNVSMMGDGELGVLAERRGFPYIVPIIL